MESQTENDAYPRSLAVKNSYKPLASVEVARIRMQPRQSKAPIQADQAGLGKGLLVSNSCGQGLRLQDPKAAWDEPKRRRVESLIVFVMHEREWQRSAPPIQP